MEDPKESLKKNWKPRAVWWAFVIVLLFLILMYAPDYTKAIPAILVAAIIVDEWFKEHYFFKPSDLKKPGTHEFIAAVITIVTVAVSLAKRLLKRGKEE